MEEHLHTLIMLQPSKDSPSAKRHKVTSSSKRVQHANAHNEKRVACAAYSKAHPLRTCESYLNKNLTERYKFVLSKNLYFNCLRSHLQKNCDLKRTYFMCGNQHHTTLHDAPNVRVIKDAPVQASHAVQHASNSMSATLLATVRVLVRDRCDNY